MRGLLAIVLLAVASAASALDHSHKAWDDLLKKHVRYVQDGNASRVDYAGFARDRAQLKAVLDDYQKVARPEFDGWAKPQQQAFLVNAYNAFTIEKILTRYPAIKSIREFGTVFGNPWKDKFFTLFGQPSYLDQVEHEILRKDGVYDEPRVHAAVVCASIGCPMLRNEAFTPDKLEAHLEDGMRRFLSDRTRNRYAGGRLEVSRIFEWFREDFAPRHAYFARYASLLADDPAARQAIAAGKAPIDYLEYDWALNDARP
jgi:hypothetical protein